MLSEPAAKLCVKFHFDSWILLAVCFIISGRTGQLLPWFLSRRELTPRSCLCVCIDDTKHCSQGASSLSMLFHQLCKDQIDLQTNLL